MSNVGVSESFLVVVCFAKPFRRLYLLLCAGHFCGLRRRCWRVHLVAHLSRSLWRWWHPRGGPGHRPRLTTASVVVWWSFATLPMLMAMCMGRVGLCRRWRRHRRQIIVTKLERCIHSLEIVTLFIDGTPHFIVDSFTAADKTEIFCLTDDRLEAEVSESG